MKLLKEVEKDRKNYHSNSNKNTVHRSSLLLPRIEGYRTVVTLLNHYLIKRGYKDVVMKISGYDKEGISGDSITFVLNEPKVYVYCLEDLLGEDLNSYQVEYFSSNNLFIPYPAVMINHIGLNGINTVHAYNRILNDPREIDKISSIDVNEASMDFSSKSNLDTFIILQTGIIGIKNEPLDIMLQSDSVLKRTIKINMPKMSIKKICVSELFEDCINKDCSAGEYSLTIHQPKQNLFYGRLLSGIEEKDKNCFSGNHSFYDNSNVEEYFDNDMSYKTFPYFYNSKNRIRIYPIMSPGSGLISIYANFHASESIKSKFLKDYLFINNETTLNININDLIKDNEILSQVSTFTVVYRPSADSKIPTRVNMQLVYGSEYESGMDASINQSLYNDELFMPKDKQSFAWCQLVNDEDYKTSLGLCFIDNYDSDSSKKYSIELDFYDEVGHIYNKEIYLSTLESKIIDLKEIKSKSGYIWVTAKSIKPQLHMFTFHTNLESLCTSGEHNF